MRGLAQRAVPERVGGVGLAGSAAVHAALIATVVLASQGRPVRVSLPAYRVELVAAAAPAEAASAGAVAEPAPTPPAARPEPAPAKRPPPSAQRAPAPPPPPSSAPAAPGRAQPATAASAAPPTPATAAPAAQPGAGADPATIRTDGVEFPFPGYLRNLVAQVYRRWRPPSGNMNLEAEVLFLVHRDGSIGGLQFVTRSGSFAFDLEAQGAIEAAARAGAFGELPAGYGPDVLPVSFFFSPRAIR